MWKGRRHKGVIGRGEREWERRGRGERGRQGRGGEWERGEKGERGVDRGGGVERYLGGVKNKGRRDIADKI